MNSREPNLKILNRQLSSLRRYLKHTVLPFSAYYRELWDKHSLSADDIVSWDDWASAPFTSKRHLLPTERHPARAKDFIIIPDEKTLKRRPETIVRALLKGKDAARKHLAEEFRPILTTSTTGRSSDPIPFFYTAHDIRRLEETGRRIMRYGGSNEEWRHLNAFPFAPHLAFWQVHYAGTGFGVFTLSTGGGKTVGTMGNVSMLNKIQPEVLIGMPTFIYHLLQQAVEAGIHCRKLRRIVLGGEKAPDGMRRKLRALCAELGAGKVSVQATYAFTEAKMAWIECPTPDGEEPSGYHLYPELGLIEIVDPETGTPVGPGQPGEIIFTPIDARGSVVLRYRTGDYIDGGLFYGVCPHCGVAVPRLKGRISRVSDFRHLQMDKIKGTMVNFNDLEHVLDDLQGVGAWQIEIRKKNDDPLAPDELTVHLHRTGRILRAELREKIEKQFQLATELRPNRIEFHDAAAMRELQGVGRLIKEEKVVDHRPVSSAQTPNQSNKNVIKETSHH